MPLFGMVGAGLLSGLGSFFGAQTQANAANNAANMQLGIYNSNKALGTPWVTTGQIASNLLSNYLGVNGTGAQTAAMNNYQNSPFFNAMTNAAANSTLAQYGARGTVGGSLQACPSKGLAHSDRSQVLARTQPDRRAAP